MTLCKLVHANWTTDNCMEKERKTVRVRKGPGYANETESLDDSTSLLERKMAERED